MNLLHRYLSRELLFAAAAAVVLFGFVLLAGNAMKELLPLLADGRVSLARAAGLIAMLAPFVITYALPMGMITAILLTLGRLSAQNEITAMRTAGVGLGRIGAPVLLIAVVGVLVSLIVNFEYGPRAKGEFRRLVSELGQSDPLSLVVPRQFIRGFAGFVIYVDRKEGDVLHDVWVWKLDRQRELEFVAHGERGEVAYLEDQNQLQLNLHNGWLHPDPLDLKGTFLPNPGGQIVPVAIPLSELFKRKVFQKKPSMLTFRELVEERERLRNKVDATAAEQKRRRDLEMAVHENAALAFSVLSLALIGVPLGIQTRRTETSANLGLAMLLTMVYYCLLVAATWVKDKPELHPELLQWLPNILFQALGGWMWWRLGKN
ncbi:MAG: LptF/LptG family permease [Opitutaceae bacterium]|nr:LptF/LptG family permease [Opitutaceae bacterium]